ncbi:MAG: hypothetical protein R8G01_01005 [Ilumatobacteraceae bacterium]|nr:hypothetical protein [Ilumatobacteraceae bacterium]
MQHTLISPRHRLAVVTAATMLVAGACGTGTTLTSPGTPAVDSTVATVAPATTEPSVAPSTAPHTTTTADVVEHSPEPTAPPTTEAPDPCGAFGAMPPRPDSMPTLAFDTDGDGHADDAVTAYGAEGGWHVRVVENDIVSEAVVDAISGWAYLTGPVEGDEGDHIVLVDNDTDQRWTFATDETGCIRAIDTAPKPGADDLAVEPVDPPEPTEIDDLASPDDELLCGPLPTLPGTAIVGNELWVDIDGVGGDDDRIVAYFDGTWKLRVEFSTGAQSEVEVSGAGAHGVRAIGFADVDLTYGGDELLAVVGGGASTVEIGVFTFLEGGCIIRYQADGGGDFSVYSGASVTHGAGVVCGEGYITSWGFERDDDDTYAVWDASFEPISLGVFGYMPSSDGYAEGVSEDELGDDLFDCNGLSL